MIVAIKMPQEPTLMLEMDPAEASALSGAKQIVLDGKTLRVQQQRFELVTRGGTASLQLHMFAS